MYSMVGYGVSPESFGAGTPDGVYGALGRWGAYTRQGMLGGMEFANKVNQFGMQQRLAPAAERNMQQQLATGTLQSQNSWLGGVSDQAIAACIARGGQPKSCRARVAMAAKMPTPTPTPTQPHQVPAQFSPQGDQGFMGPIDPGQQEWD